MLYTFGCMQGERARVNERKQSQRVVQKENGEKSEAEAAVAEKASTLIVLL